MERNSISFAPPAAVKSLVPLATTYLAEQQQGFSALTVIKTKHRNRLQPEDDMRLRPRFQQLCDVKQYQGPY
ncbi:unnamed protein product [Clavelina lepadiformis]|uniref:Uncharacterized protein n=1 Tax=Clavelina lepadiformis TaxID=159417 RepID=A0ABP0G396_CLALP